MYLTLKLGICICIEGRNMYLISTMVDLPVYIPGIVTIMCKSPTIGREFILLGSVHDSGLRWGKLKF